VGVLLNMDSQLLSSIGVRPLSSHVEPSRSRLPESFRQRKVGIDSGSATSIRRDQAGASDGKSGSGPEMGARGAISINATSWSGMGTYLT